MSDLPILREPSQRVSPRARTMWLTTSIVEALIVVGALVAASLFWDWLGARWWITVAVAALMLLQILVVPQWRYLVHRWEVTETAVYTQTGWWARERRIAPMSRIQTVDYAESAVARTFRLATVTVTTASAAGDLEIVGLDRDRARELIAELTVKADAIEGDAT